MSNPRRCSSSVPGPRAPRPTATPPPASTPSPIESSPAAKRERRYTSPWMRLLGHPSGSSSPSRRETAPPRAPYVPTHAASSFARTASPLVWRCKDRVVGEKCSAEGGDETEDSREDGEGTEVVEEWKDGAVGGLGAIRHSTLAPTDCEVLLAEPDNRTRRAASRPHLHAGPGHGPDNFSPAAPRCHQDSACCSTTSSSLSRRTHENEARQVKPRRGSSPCSGRPRSRPPPSSTVKRQPSSIARCIGEYVRPSRKGRLADMGR